MVINVQYGTGLIAFRVTQVNGIIVKENVLNVMVESKLAYAVILQLFIQVAANRPVYVAKHVIQLFPRI
jgi:hypothetical protein